jgi:hypothetical protein
MSDEVGGVMRVYDSAGNSTLLDASRRRIA